MNIYLFGHNYKYAVEQILLTLFPNEHPDYPDGKPFGDRVVLRLSEGKKYYTATCCLVINNNVFRARSSTAKSNITDEITKGSYLQKIIKLSFYRASLKSGIKKPEWGVITGIRPGKIVSKMIESGISDKTAITKFRREYDVSDNRAKLCLHTAHASLNCKNSLAPKDICLYLGIPFCPTRCSYCSFVSQSVQRSMKLIPEFLDALYKEIDATAEVVDKISLNPIALYMGGGTPTTLSAEQMDKLFIHLEKAFNLKSMREITVEAGRPDTITVEKLEVLKKHEVTRISVNPQSLNDDVLKAIGRRHTVQDFFNAMESVKKVGGFTVNTDLIAGLPMDSPDSFKKTLNEVLELSPSNITIHTLSLKRGTAITLGNTPRPSANQVREMLNYANDILIKEKYFPYYLYRQKHMSGGFENVGWQKGHTENLYNICIMEELCSIISIGGGASTKLNLGSGRIKRIFNCKYPREYIDKIEKSLTQKNEILELLTNAYSENK